ncbi:hypothetical protein ACFSJ3_03835 [Corallincola platygyrae]|uniref:STAS/SEC14 domain-containing protein n=1 Tax=Corallincola platygyrae TaxID=1193278 RepID=A0ABW4XJE6_9GAMM
MVSDKFPSHGKLNLSIENGLLIIEGEGPANIEMVMEYQARVQAYREKLRHSPWASLVLLRGIPLLPMEAKNAMVTTIQHAQSLNLVATAVVLGELQYASTVKEFWTSIYEKTNISYAYFESRHDAEQWLIRRVLQSQQKSLEG